jgi:GntR family transcriptional repressor for pyruvate dehydrogenase complex
VKIDPVSTRRLYQSVMDQFIQLISSGQLQPGDRLPAERDLAERFAVSRASIREAFRVLEIIGLIEIRPGGGTFVTNLNIGPFIKTIAPLFIRQASIEQDLLDFRLLIEAEAVRIAADKHLPSGLSDLKKALAAMEQAIEDDAPDLGAEADILFHQAVFACSDNYVLAKAAECVACLLENSVRLNRARIIKDSSQARALLDQHRSILAAIEARQGMLAAQAMSQHLEFAQATLLADPASAKPQTNGDSQ